MTIQEKALELHEKWNGKLETVSKTPVKSREDLSLAYTPGVAEPCKVIAQDKEAAYKYTMKANTVLIHRIQKKSSRLLPGLRLPTAESIWKISQLPAVLKLKRD